MSPILGRWLMYHVGVHKGCILGFHHDPYLIYSVATIEFICVLLRLIC
jgi:hypothetical protein